MEKKILKERTNVLNIKKSNLAVSSPLRSNKENENAFSPDFQPNIKSISVKSNQIQFEEKLPDKCKIRFRKHYYISEKDVLTLRYDNSDTLIANGTTDGYVKLINAKTGKPIFNFNAESEANSVSSISCLRWKPNNNNLLLAANSNGFLFQYNISDFSLVSKLQEENNQILALDYNNKGDNFATAGKDAKIRIYDDETKKQLVSLGAKQWVSPGHTNRIFSLKFINDDPNVLISGGWDPSVYIWDIRLKKCVDCIFGVCLMGDSLDYKNGQILIGNQKNKEQIQLYDYKSRNLLKVINWEMGCKMDGINVYTAQFSKKNGDYIVAGSSGGFNQMKIFSKKENYNPVFCANFLPKGCYTSDFGNVFHNLAFGGGEGCVYVCSLQNI